MQITLTLNGIRVSEEIAPDMLLIDFVRAHGCKSVKRGCETSNCGLCTVFMAVSYTHLDVYKRQRQNSIC